MRSFYKAALPLCAAGIALAGLVGSASADISDQVFVIQASNALGSGTYTVRVEDGEWVSPGEFVWNSDGEQTIRSSNGQAIAMLSQGSLHVYEDPEVTLNFSVMAGSLDTVFTVTSALVSFAAIDQVVGQASAGITVTDLDDNGVSIAPSNPNGMYTAQFNGAVPGGTTFRNLFTSPVNDPTPGATVTFSDEFPGGGGFVDITGSVVDISSRFTFTLSGNDIASGTSIFRVVEVPAPSGLALLGLGGLVVGRRRR